MGIGGSERVCVNLANEWAKDHEVHIVVLNLENDVNTHLLDERVKVHELGVSRLRYAAIPMFRYIKKYDPEFLFIFGTEMAVILDKLKKMRLVKTRLVVRILNNVNISLSKDDHVSPVVENYLKKAQSRMKEMDVIIAQCKAMGNMLKRAYRVSDDKLFFPKLSHGHEFDSFKGKAFFLQIILGDPDVVKCFIELDTVDV